MPTGTAPACSFSLPGRAAPTTARTPGRITDVVYHEFGHGFHSERRHQRHGLGQRWHGRRRRRRAFRPASRRTSAWRPASSSIARRSAFAISTPPIKAGPRRARKCTCRASPTAAGCTTCARTSRRCTATRKATGWPTASFTSRRAARRAFPRASRRSLAADDDDGNTANGTLEHLRRLRSRQAPPAVRRHGQPSPPRLRSSRASRRPTLTGSALYAEDPRRQLLPDAGRSDVGGRRRYQPPRLDDADDASPSTKGTQRNCVGDLPAQGDTVGNVQGHRHVRQRQGLHLPAERGRSDVRILHRHR